MKLGKDHIEQIKKQHKLLSHKILQKREFTEHGLNERIEFHRDYTRILYSSAFRRLQGKMQILGIESTAFYRNRLTHSLEVSQIARSIALNLTKACGKLYNNEDMYLIEAASLAHDIGHPPFGHKGERVLNNICEEVRFEGNAQNFRVLRTLEKKGYNYNGLNLTNRLLLAINKYIKQESKDDKKFLYKEDFEYLKDIRNQTGLDNIRTLDVQIIDIADDIAYAVHDLEDALSLKYFDVSELIFEMKVRSSDSCEKLKDIIKKVNDYAMQSERRKTIQEFSQVFRKRLTSDLTHLFINDISLLTISEEESKKNGTINGAYELSLNEYKQLLKDLKDAIFECINRYQDISLYEKRGEIVIHELFKIFKTAPELLPPDYRSKEHIERNIIDYISGMMDAFAISEYERLTGKSFSNLNPTNTSPIKVSLAMIDLKAKCAYRRT